MRRPIWLLMTILLFGVLLGTACGGGGSATDAHDDDDGDDHAETTATFEDEYADLKIAIEMGEFSFGPADITMRVGEVVEITLSNGGMLLHDFTIEKIDGDVHITGISGVVDHEHETAGMASDDGDENDVHIALDPGGEGLVKLKAHEAGTYTFYCTVPGHREGGMEGTLTVS